MNDNYNDILKSLSIENVQIDKFDHEPKDLIKPAIKDERVVVLSDETTPKKKRGRKSQKIIAVQSSGRRFRGKDYTSTRVRKDLMGLLRLLYDNMTSVEMLECLIIQHLEQNKRLLAKKVANIKLDI